MTYKCIPNVFIFIYLFVFQPAGNIGTKFDLSDIDTEDSLPPKVPSG